MVEKYIRQLNECLPTINEVQENFRKKAGKELNVEQAEAYRNGMLIQYEKESDCENPIEDLVLNTNIPFVGIGSINFKFEIEDVRDGLKQFAEYNDDLVKICFDNKGSIYVLDEDQDKIEILTDNYDVFFRFIVFYQRAYTNKIFRGNSLLGLERDFAAKLTSEGFSKRVLDDLLQEII